MRKEDTLQYWNDVEAEKKKPYYITSNEDQKLLRWLREESNFERAFSDALSYASSNLGGLKGRVLDVGAGVCWTSAIMASRYPTEEVMAIDLSQHRLNLIAPFVLDQFGVSSSKIKRAVGDFLKHPFVNDTFDAIVFCQAACMFHDLTKIMIRCYELLKPEGYVIIACEKTAPVVNSLQFVKSLIKRIDAKMRAVSARSVPKDATGRYDYLDKHYKDAILSAGLTYHYQRLKYPLLPKASSTFTGNYFGVKSKNSDRTR